MEPEALDELRRLSADLPARVLWCADRLPAYFEAADLVVTMAGYNTLLEAVSLYEERLQGGGERTCVSLRGQRLHLLSARALSADVDLTDAVRRGHGQTDFYLVDEAAIVPCSDLTR